MSEMCVEGIARGLCLALALLAVTGLLLSSVHFVEFVAFAKFPSDGCLADLSRVQAVFCHVRSLADIVVSNLSEDVEDFSSGVN